MNSWVLVEKTLASILGVSKSAVRDWEQGQREPPTIALNFCELLLNLNGSHLINRIKKEHDGRSTSKFDVTQMLKNKKKQPSSIEPSEPEVTTVVELPKQKAKKKNYTEETNG